MPLTERAELAHLEEQVMRMFRKHVAELPELIEEELKLVLIVGVEIGLNVFSKTFYPERPLAEQFIAGFLTTINAFKRDTFDVGGSIEWIKHTDYIVLLKPVEPFLVCYYISVPLLFCHTKIRAVH